MATLVLHNVSLFSLITSFLVHLILFSVIELRQLMWLLLPSSYFLFCTNVSKRLCLKQGIKTQLQKGVMTKYEHYVISLKSSSAALCRPKKYQFETCFVMPRSRNCCFFIAVILVHCFELRYCEHRAMNHKSTITEGFRIPFVLRARHIIFMKSSDVPSCYINSLPPSFKCPSDYNKNKNNTRTDCIGYADLSFSI